jgi:hypothetical protein
MNAGSSNLANRITSIRTIMVFDHSFCECDP